MTPRRSSHRSHSSRRGFTLLELVMVVLIVLILIALLLPAVQQAREAARSTQCKNNLMQLNLALHEYSMVHRTLPPGCVNETAPVYNLPRGSHYSWMVQVLPYIEQGNLHDDFDFTRSVYDLKNRQERAFVLHLLFCPSSPSPSMKKHALTTYAGCHHDREAPIGLNQNGVLHLNSRITRRDIPDGRANTIYLSEVVDPGELGWASGTRATLRNVGTPLNDPSAWEHVGPGWWRNVPTVPGFAPTVYEPKAEDDDGYDPFEEPLYDLRLFDPYGLKQTDGAARTEDGRTKTMPDVEALEKSPDPQDQELLNNIRYVGGFSSFHPGGVNMAFGDGSVRRVSQLIDGTLLQRLANRRDRQPVGEF